MKELQYGVLAVLFRGYGHLQYTGFSKNITKTHRIRSLINLIWVRVVGIRIGSQSSAETPSTKWENSLNFLPLVLGHQ